MQPKQITYSYRFLLTCALIVVTFLTMTRIEIPAAQNINDKASHALAFFALALLLDFSFPVSGFHAGKMLSLLGYGLLIEIIQYFLPYRSFSLLDLAADGLGLLLYRGMIPFLKKMPLLKGRWE